MKLAGLNSSCVLGYSVDSSFVFATVCICVVGFVIGLLFTQRCGNYFVTMFDNYSASMPLIIVVMFETISISWVYGADR